MRNSGTLLLVDDEPNIIHALNRLLRRDGYNILSAFSAAEAFAVLEHHHVDVLIADQRMPVMTGMELLMRVKRLYPDVMRILLSGWPDTELIMNAVELGDIHDFVAKPWSDKELRRRIAEAIALGRHVLHKKEG
ncbi:MAG: response regulator [Gammaproteobacteria bacterium]